MLALCKKGSDKNLCYDKPKDFTFINAPAHIPHRTEGETQRWWHRTYEHALQVPQWVWMKFRFMASNSRFKSLFGFIYKYTAHIPQEAPVSTVSILITLCAGVFVEGEAHSERAIWQTWSISAPMSIPRFGCVCVSVEGKVLISEI